MYDNLEMLLRQLLAIHTPFIHYTRRIQHYTMPIQDLIMS